MRQSITFPIFGFVFVLLGKTSNALTNNNKRKHYKISRRFDSLDLIRSEALFASMSSSSSSDNPIAIGGRPIGPVSNLKGSNDG